jgi:hypothetical protein
LYVSDAKTKDSWANHSKDGKWKDHYADLTPEFDRRCLGQDSGQRIPAQ